ncbi:MAG: DUF308 domain-containing protein [Lachnospiraceae bacterium]|nr:DUF308 domain-containing protein [Lachnospiraceae bacterium]
MKKRNEKGTGIIQIIGEILIGILLFIRPIGFTTGIITIFGVLLVVAGIAQIISYFRSDPLDGAANGSLSKGLLEMVGGLFCVLDQEWFIVTFPALTILYGIGMLVSGFTKIESATNMARLKAGQWTWGLLSAALTLICAIIILSNPFTSTIVLWRFVAASFIVEAVVDVIAIFLSKKEPS